MIAEVGDHTVAGVVDQIGTDVVADAFEDGGDNEGEGYDGPGVVKVGWNDLEEVELIGRRELGKERNAGSGDAGLEDGAEDGSEDEKAERC